MSHVDPFGLDSCGPDDAKTVKCPQTGDRVTKDGPNSYDIRAPGETIIDETGRAAASGWSRGIEHGAAALERLATTPHEVPGGYTFTPTEYWKGLVNESADQLQDSGTMLSPQGALITWALGGGRPAPRARMSMSGGPNDISKDAARVAVILGSFAIGKGLSARSAATAGGFRSFEAFKRAMGPAGPGQAWHHIVEQTPGNVARFGPQAIHNTGNIVRLPHGAGSIHARIGGLYSSIRPAITGSNTLTVRRWLSTQSFEAQAAFGRQAIENVAAGLW